MSWRQVAVIYALLTLLISYMLIFERATPPPDGIKATTATDSLLGTEALSVTAVTFQRGGKSVRATRDDQRWHVIEPPGAEVPPDLVDAAIATLTVGQASEKLSHESESALSVFGLDAPSASVELVMREAPERSITVFVGARNPTRTAVYARRSDQASIFLVGMNLSYYVDLIFDASKP